VRQAFDLTGRRAIGLGRLVGHRRRDRSVLARPPGRGHARRSATSTRRAAAADIVATTGNPAVDVAHWTSRISRRSPPRRRLERGR